MVRDDSATLEKVAQSGLSGLSGLSGHPEHADHSRHSGQLWRPYRHVTEATSHITAPLLH